MMRNRIFSAILFLALIGTAALAAQTALPGMAQRQASVDAVNLATQFESGLFESRGYRSLPYRYFDPSAHGAPGGKYPVILYLHSESAAGTDNQAQLTTTDAATVWMQPHHLAQHPSYVLAPQIPVGTAWTDENIHSAALALLEQFMQRHPDADRNRIYLVGFSMGGTGTWNMLLKNPELFASAMVISGSADAWLDDYEAWAALKHTPIVIVHAYDDRVVPVSHAQNAISALQAAGGAFVSHGGPTPALWTPGSTPSPHDAWQTAFDKFEVIYNSLFWGDLGKTQNGKLDPTTLFSQKDLGDGVTEIWDWALGTAYVIERGDETAIVDTTMGRMGADGGIYHYIRDHILKNRDSELSVYITHQHGDHIRGLASFIGADQLKKVYVHKSDSRPVKAILGPDAGKVVLLEDGDRIPFAGGEAEVINVPGHSLGSVIFRYGDYLFSGDTVGTGYVGVSRISIEDYVDSLTHLLERMGSERYQILGGHSAELTAPLSERYVQDLLATARGIVDGSLAGAPYWRAREIPTRKVSTVGRSSITYQFRNIKRIEGALYSLELSDGVLRSGHGWRDEGFSGFIARYQTTLDESVATLDIIPTVFTDDYRRLTINGRQVDSGEPVKVPLAPGKNRFEITVTTAKGATRTYTLDAIRGA